jgi:hypothetical protein
MSKHNIKALLTELFQFYVSIPESREKHELDRILTMIKLGHSDLKSILLIINKNLEKSKTLKVSERDKSIQIWSYVFSIFSKYLKG